MGQLDRVVASGADVVTVSELVARRRAGGLDRRTVAIAFDDGAASAVRVAGPLLAERGLTATYFCVAGHLGGTSDWPSAWPETPRLELAAADELAELAEQGFEIGCHGMTHAPLVSDDPGFLLRELGEAKAALEQAVGTSVRSYAFPYGALGPAAARRVVEATFESACSTMLGFVGAGSDVHALPRIDAHYVRRPSLLRTALAGTAGPYLRTRRLGASARRLVRSDYRAPSEA